MSTEHDRGTPAHLQHAKVKDIPDDRFHDDGGGQRPGTPAPVTTLAQNSGQLPAAAPFGE